jgi:hypothetical protein
VICGGGAFLSPLSITALQDLFSHQNQRVARQALANELVLSATIEPHMALNQRRKKSRSPQPATEESYNFNAGSVPHYWRVDTSLLLTGEDPEEFRQHCQMVFDRFPARDEVERNVVQDLANLQWRLNRIPELEAAMFAKGDWAGVSALALYEQRLVGRFEQARRTLIKLQMEALPGEKARPS